MPAFNNKLLQLTALIVAAVYFLIEAKGNGDFFIFMSAAGDLDGQTDIFTKSYLDGFHYYYSLLFALVLKPFYRLPFYGVKFCWLMLNFAACIHLYRLLKSSALVSYLDEKQKRVFLILLFLFSFRFLHQNFHTSQITILIFWLCVYGIYLIKSSKPVSGGTLLALGINIKLLPIVFLPYLFYRGYFKALTITVLVYVFSMVLPYFIIGKEYYVLLLDSWFNLINPTEQRHILDVDERSFHGLSTLLSTLLVKNVPDPQAMKIDRNIMDVSLETLSNVLLFARLFLVTLTLYFLKWPPFKKEASKWKELTALAYILLLIPVIFPHQQHYAFLFITPSFGVLLSYLIWNYKTISKMTKRIVIFFLSVIYLTANLSVLLGEFNGYYEHFKILTYGALLLIPMLVWVSGKDNVAHLRIPE